MDKFYENLSLPHNRNRLKNEQLSLMAQVLHNSFEMTNEVLELTEGPRYEEIIHDDLACKILTARMKAFDLKIKFKISGLLGVSILATNPGKAIICLIDCLCRFGDEAVIGIEEIDSLYGKGFYSEFCLENYVDNYLKKNKSKWSNLY